MVSLSYILSLTSTFLWHFTLSTQVFKHVQSVSLTCRFHSPGLMLKLSHL